MEAHVSKGASWIGAGLVGCVLFEGVAWIVRVLASLGTTRRLASGALLFDALAVIVLVACTARGVTVLARGGGSSRGSPR